MNVKNKKLVEDVKGTFQKFLKNVYSVLLLCRNCHDKLHQMMKENFGQWIPPKDIVNLK